MTQGVPQGRELVLPSCSAAPGHRLLNMLYKPLWDPATLTRGPGDDNSHCVLNVFSVCF